MSGEGLLLCKRSWRRDERRNPPDSLSRKDGEDLRVPFGDPSLMEQEFETVLGEMHRWPYIMLW
jgi:hypothetical protein